MVKKTEERITEERKEVNEEKKDNFKTQVDNYTAVSKLWEDSYLKLYRPWLESTGELFEKAVELSKDAAPGRYTEFYEEWVKTYKNSFGKFYSIPAPETSKEILEKLARSAEESNKIYRSWIAELEENSRKTQEVLRGEPDPVKYKEVYDLWIKSYGKIFDDLLTLPFRENIKEIFESFAQSTSIYLNLYKSWIATLEKLSWKAKELSKQTAEPETYKQYYNLWAKTYEKSFDIFFENTPTIGPFKDILESAKNASKIYAEIFTGGWIKSSPAPAISK